MQPTVQKTDEAAGWRDFHSRFTELANEEQHLVQQIVDATGRNLCMYAYRTRQGQWKFGGGIKDDFREQVRTLAVGASIYIGAPKDADREDSWLDRLYRFLCEMNSSCLFEQNVLDSSEETFPKYGGGILRVCEASASFCSWLERKALEHAENGSPAQNSDKTPQGVESRSWSEIEIAFLSDERIEICIGVDRKTYNYTEFGFEDRRDGKPNRAWEMLREMSSSGGTISRPLPGKYKAKIQKPIEQIRKKLCSHFGMQTDPIPFNGNTYQASFKIRRRLSFET